MQRVGELVFNGARTHAPLFGILEPIRAAGCVRPRADVREARLQRVEIALAAIELIDLRLDPLARHTPTRRHDVPGDAQRQLCVLVFRELAKIRELASVPQPAHVFRRLHAIHEVSVVQHAAEHELIVGAAHTQQAVAIRRALKRRDQSFNAIEFQIGIAPLHRFDGFKLVRFNALDNFFVKRLALTRLAEMAVAGEATGAAGDLGDFVGPQIAPRMAIELAPRGERDVIDIHVEAHADGVCRDQEIHLAALIELDLGIARAGAERAHHHGRAAAMATQQFGDRVNFLGRKRDDG